MKKLLTTLALALGLMFSGAVVIAAPASAEDCQAGSCTPAPEPCPAGGCTPAPEPCPAGGCTPEPPVTCPQAGGCDAAGYVVLLNELHEVEMTANDYRAQVVALTEKVAALTATVERVQRTADRRAATIQRLRAVIRALR